MEKFFLFFFGLWWEGGHNDAECSMEVLDLSPCGRWDVGGENDAWMKKGKHTRSTCSSFKYGHSTYKIRISMIFNIV